MKWHYDLNHAEPIIRDEWLQDGQGSGGYVNSVTMNAGALVCQGTAEQITITACGAEYTAKLAYSNTINSSATNCLGVLLETPYASGTGSSFMGTATSTTATIDLPTTAPTPPNQYHSQGPQSCQHGKVIINPGAVYLCQQRIGVGDAIAVSSVNSTTLQSIVAGNIGTYVYFPNLNANAATSVKGSLRWLYNTSGTSGAMSHTLTGTATTSDYFVIIYGKGNRGPYLTSDSTMASCSTAAVTAVSTNLVIAETYMDCDRGIEIMRPYNCGDLDNLHLTHGGASGTNYTAGPKFYYDLIMKSHLYGNSI